MWVSPQASSLLSHAPSPRLPSTSSIPAVSQQCSSTSRRRRGAPPGFPHQSSSSPSSEAPSVRVHSAAGPKAPSLEISLDASKANQEEGSHKYLRRLVVAVNDTEESWYAVKWTLSNIYREGDMLHLVHCVPRNNVVPLPSAFLATINDSMDYEELLEVHAYEFINQTMVQMASSMKAQSHVDILHVSGPQNAGDALCKFSENLGASLVVIASQPQSKIEEFLTGGCMSGHAIEQCKLPTLILPPQILSN